MKNLCVILSVINPISAPLSYAPRSVFTCQERFEQTLLSIESVSTKIPNVDIYLVECSNVPQEMEDILKSRCNYINYYHNPHVRQMVESPFKGSGEASQMISILEHLDLEQYDNIFKLSGRYRLSENFDYNKFDNEDNCYYITNNGRVSTIFYKIKNYTMSLYKDILKTTCHLCYHNQMIFEQIIYNLFKDYIIHIPILGIEGHCAVDKNSYANY